MDSLERLPPQAIEAEGSVLGAILISQAALDEVLGILSPSDFYSWQHQTIFRVVVELSAKNAPADLVTVSTALRERGELDEVGGYSYLMDLAGSIPTAVNAPYYARIVQEKAEARKVITLGHKFIEVGHDEGKGDPMERATGLLLEAVNQSTESEVQPLSEIAAQVDAEVDLAIQHFDQYRGERIPGRVLTGIHDLDQFTLGFGEDHLILVAGRPGMGKTSLLFQIGKNVAAGLGGGEMLPVVAFSLEMGKAELARRLACGIADVNGERVTQGFVTPNERELLREATAYLASLPLYIDDGSSVTVARVRNVARKLKARHGRLGAVIVDYVGLMASMTPEGKRGYSNRQEEVAAISRGLKMLARELRCPVLLGAQLNRQAEGRGDKRPGLSDLRESGALEQDANIVLLLYRDELYNADSNDKGTAEVIIPKNRGGRTGTVKLGYNAPTTNFYCLTTAPAPRPSYTYAPKPKARDIVRNAPEQDDTPSLTLPYAPPEYQPFTGTEVQELGEDFA